MDIAQSTCSSDVGTAEDAENQVTRCTCGTSEPADIGARGGPWGYSDRHAVDQESSTRNGPTEEYTQCLAAICPTM